MEQEEEIKSKEIQVEDEVETNKQALPQVLAKKDQKEIKALDFPSPSPFPNKVVNPREKSKRL